MIIADILRKKIKHAKRFLSDVWNGTDSDQIDINRFAGDLAKKDAGKTVTNPEKSQSVMQSVHDSKDAYVFLTYLNHPHKGWTCTDCGTINVFWTNTCEVCGLVQK